MARQPRSIKEPFKWLRLTPTINQIGFSNPVYQEVSRLLLDLEKRYKSHRGKMGQYTTKAVVRSKQRWIGYFNAHRVAAWTDNGTLQDIAKQMGGGVNKLSVRYVDRPAGESQRRVK